MKVVTLCLAAILLAGCSVGKTETAPYTVINTAPDKNIEVRRYDTLVLASTGMAGDDRNGAFRKLFNYITGDNVDTAEISMTTPVIMDDNKKQSGAEIPMTTPVFMDDGSANPMMSFVLPAGYTIENAPKPKNPAVTLSEVKDYNVAAIIFSGTLSERNVAKHKDILTGWLNENKYEITGDYKQAAYNAPFTLPMFRRNEVIIPIKKK